MLLDLPPEILEMILLVLPPDSFSCMLMTCKSIRTTILSTQKILRTQLGNLPGLRQPDQATPTELLKTFNRRAAQSAWNGLEPFADIVIHQPQLPEPLNEFWTRPRFNWIQRCCDRRCDRGLLATAADYRGVVHIFRIRKGSITALGKIDPRSLGLEEIDSQAIRYRCLAVRWQQCNTTNHADHLLGLFSCTVDDTVTADNGRFAKQFVAEAAVKASHTYHLCSWKLCKSINAVWATTKITLPPTFKPIILTTKEDRSKDNKACVPAALVSLSSELNRYLIQVFRIKGNRITTVPVMTSETSQDDTVGLWFPYPVLRARFSKGLSSELYLYSTDTAPFDNILGCDNSAAQVLRLANGVSTITSTPPLFPSTAFPRNFKGLLIKMDHDCECGVYENGSRFCVQTLLELVVPRTSDPKLRGAYLVKYAEEQDVCSPLTLHEEPPALEYTVVAKLLGSEYKVQSPLGTVKAVSPNGQWVAIAHWDSIKIWGLHTKAFLSSAYGSLPSNALARPIEGSSPRTWLEKQNKARSQELSVLDDKAYFVNCGQGFFHDHIRVKGEGRKRIVGIRPIELPSRGVVYCMAFAKRNVLWAWTDKGLVKWAWNKKRSGRRDAIALAMVPDDLWAFA